VGGMNMIVVLGLLLVTRTYHVTRVADLARSVQTHVQVSGYVTYVRHEADGDWHVRVSDGLVSIVAEIIPAIPLPVPRVGQCVQIRGIRRIDRERGHRQQAEVHPVEGIAVVPCPEGTSP
jgi:hypothetical protein